MNDSMEDYLKVVISYLPVELVVPVALTDIQTLARNLPAFSVAGFECRLGTEKFAVDFQVNLPCYAPKLPAHLLENNAWQDFYNFCHKWIKPNSLLHRSVDNVWLEFDINGKPLAIPIPCIFLALKEETARQSYWLQEIISSWPFQLNNELISRKIKSNLWRCAEYLPDAAWITHLGAMLSRSNAGVRVNIRGIAPDKLLNYLQKIGWQEDTNQLNQLGKIISSLEQFVDYIVLTFDVGETISPRIGLECFLTKQPPSEPRWQLFLEYLVANNLCTPEKQKGLLAWPGISQKKDCPELWPKNLNNGDFFLNSQALSLFWRTISLIKIVYQPGMSVEAKGYLAFGHKWFDIKSLHTKY